MATMKLNIDLGKSEGDYPMAMTAPARSAEKYYPRFSYSGEEELGLPKEGTMVIRYREVAKSEREKRDGTEEYTCEIEVREIISAEGEKEVESPATSSAKDTEDALDNLARNQKSKKY